MRSIACRSSGRSDLPEYPVAKYYRFDFLKEALGELKLLRSWDPAFDASDAKLTAAVV